MRGKNIKTEASAGGDKGCNTCAHGLLVQSAADRNLLLFRLESKVAGGIGAVTLVTTAFLFRVPPTVRSCYLGWNVTWL